MSRLRVAILAGGYSSEWEISMLSASVVKNNLDPVVYESYIVEIKKSGWKVQDGDSQIPLDLNAFGFQRGNEFIKFDVAFNAIHGDPGENGKLQGYMEALGIKHTSSNQAVSALTFSKWQCNLVLQKLGFTCAKSILLQKGDALSPAKIVNELGLPLFVKPNNAGSSFGVSKVKQESEISAAVQFAMKEDPEVVLEAFMDGIELGCGVFKYKGQIIALPPTEIRSENEFFDYEAKYLGKSKEITPAEISEELIDKIKSISASAYHKINASGVIRVDFILVGETANIVEINTIPGLSSESIVPQQARCAGYSLQDFFGMLLQEALS